ncbi:MAG: hypothetical protein UBAL2_85240062 [Leptospirillum rubarum]|jgi:hypothetical protein|nr:MAG: hypothetical protein UBAL2_85240062 [Leptospirillum rubarum]
MTEIKADKKVELNEMIPSITKSDSFTKVYANTLRVNISFQDVSIVFGDILEPRPDIPFKIEDLTEVRLPVAQAKILSNVLSASIKLYENHFGKVTIPKQFNIDEYQKLIEPIVQNIKKQIS